MSVLTRVSGERLKAFAKFESALGRWPWVTSPLRTWEDGRRGGGPEEGGGERGEGGRGERRGGEEGREGKEGGLTGSFSCRVELSEKILTSSDVSFKRVW